ncbi:hypothetical protein L6452_14048 [Arctium lappa]|uniref:Uncharacterized protein n=1 Tax=Arctium lappa TaxID=4217 RepID=A0ACB9CKC6_ARCLA|nr:hypothetical protein L6452_14048 [Arctium lappa]
MIGSTLNKEILNSSAKFWKKGPVLVNSDLYLCYLGKIETKQREKEEHFILATQYYNKASIIDMHEPSTWVGKGFKFVPGDEGDEKAHKEFHKNYTHGIGFKVQVYVFDVL